ncbi:acyl-CoA dehydrogenase family protein [Rhodococcus antarcticus]|uniref:Acyl-CoA dehydrogenase family protein n=1 Tax=Rhodococcus antarcticus TaxID=2987751 RepID=A0ABY6P035_9NOCA|nr:acyl-CoA dehydrogenase family protein [Rhodococcus antarcticus]UZJ25019.1 acyl-CoA dehydrogenase family protein [Rhodococcus antarcticus]
MSEIHQGKVDPLAAAGDFYDVKGMLAPDERAVLDRVTAFVDSQVKPIANEYWLRGEFPRQLVAGFRELGIAGLTYTEHGCPGGSYLLSGLVAQELCRGDASVGTFYGVHAGLALGSLMLCGSEEQKARFAPSMLSWERIGAFGLTEPEVGSAVAQGLQTTATRDGDTWVLNGEKKWIGNGTFADVVVIWARDTADDEVKGFLVETPTDGFTAENIEDKIALRSVENAVLHLHDVRVPEANRLQEANSFADTARVLKATRAGVAWNSVGCAMGAYEAARAYTVEREQFGQPTASFQLVQDLLSRMLANTTASQCLAARLSQLQDAGGVSEQQASLAKMYCTTRTRETVQWARESMGGNGILLEHDVARFFVDSEALYSYEGTREVNSLIVGRAITGYGAFV